MALAVDVFSQNSGKEELLTRHLPGKVVTVARHFGSHLGEKATFAHELPRKRQAMKTGFYSVGQLRYESRVLWRLKRCLFISRLVNTALPGIEAFCPSKAQYLPCEKSYALFGGAQRSTRADPHHDEPGLAFLETGTSRCWSPSAKTQVGADAGAKPRASCAADRGVVWEVTSGAAILNGEITPEANLWAARWVADLRDLEPFDERGVVQRVGSDVRALFFWTAN